MISHQLRSVPVTGYYEHISPIRHRTNVTPNEQTDSEETLTRKTTNTLRCVATVMENGNRASLIKSLSADNLQRHSANLNDKDVTKWTSSDVQYWLEEQCRKFELKKATTEKFQMNGQALVLLTKDDFLRRSPDGGEVLYYALQRLNTKVDRNKFDSVRVDQSLVISKVQRQNPRIIELDSDTDEHNSPTSTSSSTKPIVEEPDDPPLLRKQNSDIMYENYHQQYYPHPFIYNNPLIRQPFFTMPGAATGAYYHQQPQVYPNMFMYPQQPQVHPHIPQQQFFHPHPQVHFIQQYYSMMAAQGILIEVIDREEANNLITTGVHSPSLPNATPTNGVRFNTQEQLYLVTMNGQRFVMTEEHIRQIVTDIQQQQQQHFQQQQFYQQQQQQFHQQQYTYQQPPPHQDNVYYAS